MLEQYEKQYAASAAAHSDQSSKKAERTHKTATTLAKDESVKQEQPKSTEPGAGRKVQRGGVFCWGCPEAGHIKRNCPKKAEAPGRSKVANTAAVEASPTAKVDDLTEEQLEQMLADRRLLHEQSLLHGTTTTNAVHAEEDGLPAVGPTLLLDVSIEGLLVKATIDTGAQSTII